MDKEREVAFHAAREAGTILRSRLGNIKSLDYKGQFDLVTDVDKASEKCVIDILKSNFSEDVIFAEESGLNAGTTNRRWLIDPLDGTTNYAHSYPFFCISIGFELDSKIVLGVVYNPITDELFYAQEDGQAFLNGNVISVSSSNELGDSLLATGFPANTKGRMDNNFKRFCTLTDMSHGVRRDGAAALDLCYVACGRLDGFWETKLNPWDMAAGSLIVRQAGGRISALDGKEFDLNSGYVLATNSHIHDQIVNVLNTVEA